VRACARASRDALEKKNDDQIFLVGILTLLPMLRLITVSFCIGAMWVVDEVGSAGGTGAELRSWFAL